MTWRGAFRAQADNCEALGSPFTAGLLRLIADSGLPAGAIARRIADWPGDIGSSGASVPLRLAGALHGLVLEGRDAGLAACYPAAGGRAGDASLWPAVRAAIVAHEDWLMQRLDTAPQTNEVGRSAALILAAHWLGTRTGLPLVLSELGASAGLNLLFDRYALATPNRILGPGDPALVLRPDWRGAPVPVRPAPRITDRAGADLAPIDSAADRLRLSSFVWPDQPQRLARIAAALAEAARLRPAVARADAIDWLAGRLAGARPDRLHLVYHTVAWQYFPDTAQRRGEALLAEAGARATDRAPLARFAMEADGAGPGAGLSLTLWPGGARKSCGRIDFHGRWIDWQDPD